MTIPQESKCIDSIETVATIHKGINNIHLGTLMKADWRIIDRHYNQTESAIDELVGIGAIMQDEGLKLFDKWNLAVRTPAQGRDREKLREGIQEFRREFHKASKLAVSRCII